MNFVIYWGTYDLKWTFSVFIEPLGHTCTSLYHRTNAKFTTYKTLLRPDCHVIATLPPLSYCVINNI